MTYNSPVRIISEKTLSSRSLQNNTKLPKYSYSAPSENWTRNPSWLALPSVSAEDDKFVGLYKVEKNSAFCSLYVSLASSTDTYEVDWGDGNTETINHATWAYHQYDFDNSELDGTNAPVTFQGSADTVTRSNHGYTNGMKVSFDSISTTTGIYELEQYYVINATTNTFQLSFYENGSAIDLVNDGTGYLLPYKQAIVTVTPSSTFEIRQFNIHQRHSSNPMYYNIGWLDIALSFPNATYITFSSGTQSVYYTNLEQASIYNLGNITNLNDLFYNCRSLRSLPVFNISESATTLYRAFTGCHSIEEIPDIASTSSLTNLDSIFTSCYSLRNVPTFSDTSNVTNIRNLFYDCFMIRTIPQEFDFSSVLYSYSVFYRCINLEHVPKITLGPTAELNNFFRYCISLTSVPFFNTSSATNSSYMFENCARLSYIPSYDFSNVTNTSYMFSYCYSIKDLPWFDFSSTTSTRNMFYYCVSLKNIKTYNFQSSTDSGGMFYYCRNLKSVPDLNFTAGSLTYTRDMFRECKSLVSVVAFDTSSVTNAGYMFYVCTVLEEIPYFDFSSCTTMDYAISYCYNLRQLNPNYDFSNVQVGNGMLGYNITLKSIPKYSFDSMTSAYALFAGNNSLEEIPNLSFPAATDCRYMFQTNQSLHKPPLIEFGGSNVDCSYMFQNCPNIVELPEYDYSNVYYFTNIFNNTFSLKRIRATGISQNIVIGSSTGIAYFSGDALNEIYTNLPTVSGKTITVSGNWGTSSDNPSIATAKGWTVSG